MTSTLIRPPGTSTPVRQEFTTLRQDVIGVLCGFALIGGLFADAWAHSNISQTLEGFFTPWHALLYSGFAVTAGWTWWLAFRHRREDERWWRNSWPVGYRLGAVGSLIFLVGGAGDMFWHQIFGVEVSLKVALSPSHLAITGGAVLLLTSQLRSWWASGEGGGRTATGIISMMFGTILGLIILVGLTSVFSVAATREFVPSVQGATSTPNPAAQGVQGYLLGTVLLLIPFLLLHRRRATMGAATAIIGGVGIFGLLQREFPMPGTVAVIGMIVGALIADVILTRLDVTRGPQAPMRLPIAGGVLAGAMWTGHMIGLAVGDAVRWPPELWAGSVIISAILGGILGALAAGRPQPAEPAVPQ